MTDIPLLPLTNISNILQLVAKDPLPLAIPLPLSIPAGSGTSVTAHVTGQSKDGQWILNTRWGILEAPATLPLQLNTEITVRLEAKNGEIKWALLSSSPLLPPPSQERPSAAASDFPQPLRSNFTWQRALFIPTDPASPPEERQIVLVTVAGVKVAGTIPLADAAIVPPSPLLSDIASPDADGKAPDSIDAGAHAKASIAASAPATVASATTHTAVIPTVTITAHASAPALGKILLQTKEGQYLLSGDLPGIDAAGQPLIVEFLLRLQPALPANPSPLLGLTEFWRNWVATASSGEARSLPHPDTKLAARLEELAALLLGQEEKGDSAKKPFLFRPVSSDMAPLLQQLSQMAQGNNSDGWRIFLLPFLTPQGLLFLTWRDRKRDKEQAGKKQPYRFLVSIFFSALGGIQLEGLLAEQRLDMVLSSSKAMPDALCRDLTELYKREVNTMGLEGEINFRIEKIAPSLLSNFTLSSDCFPLLV